MEKTPKNILIVEDSLTHQLLFKGLIEKAFRQTDQVAQISAAKTFEEAVDKLQDGDVKIDAIVLDNGFPMGGERLGSSREGGAEGMQLFSMIRGGEIEGLDTEIPIAWNTATFGPEKEAQLRERNEEHNIPEDRTIMFEKNDAIKVLGGFLTNILDAKDISETRGTAEDTPPKSWGDRTSGNNEGPSGSSSGHSPF